jgi:RNA polymerase sigma factor (sigma-70 family)
MDDALTPGTSPTLLGRLRQDPADAAAWRTFVLRYGPRIHAWCCQWRLQEADAQDVTQAVLLKLVARMRTFTYDASGSFRGWLKTVTYHAWRDYLHGQQRAGQGSGDSAALAALQCLEAGDDLTRRLQEEFDLELLEEAAARVRLRVKPHTWEAYRLLTEERLSVPEVAQHLGMQVAMVFVARSKIKRMLREQVRQLERAPESPAPGR